MAIIVPSHRRAVAALALAALLSSLGTSIANVGLPALAEAFGASFAQVQWVVLAYLIAVTALVVAAGRLGDRIGRRRALLGGILLFAVGSMLCAAAPSLELLIAARAAQGLGAAAMMALGMALVSDVVPESEAGRALGLLGTLSAVGTGLGPSLGGLLLAGPGWRALFLVNVPIAAVAFVLAFRHLPAQVIARRARRGASMRPPRLPSPLRDSRLGAGLAASMLVSAVMMATLIVGPFYLSGALGLGPVASGLALAAGPLVAALAGVPAGVLADRAGAGRMRLAGLAAMAGGCLLLAFAPGGPGLLLYIGAMAVLTAGYALFQTANNKAVMAGSEPGRRGTVSGLLNLSRNLGLVAGAAGMGALFAAASGAADVAAASPAAVAAGMRSTFAVAAALVAAALGASVAASSRQGAGQGPSQKPRFKALGSL